MSADRNNYNSGTCSEIGNDAPLLAEQPFRLGQSSFRSSVIEDLIIHYEEPLITMRCANPWITMSNGVHRGGVEKATTIMNYRVPLDYCSDDPVSDFVQLMEQRCYSTKQSVGFMTAAKLSHAAISQYKAEHFSSVVLATAGTSNAARAGCQRQMFGQYEAGTINLFIWIDGRMSEAAMVNAIMTATEAKAAALADLSIIEKSNGKIATGTTTDAICLSVSGNQKFTVEHHYAGTATILGCMLARLVYSAIYKAVETQQLQ